MTRVLVISGFLVVFGVSLVVCGIAPVQQCDGSHFENLRDNVDVSPCRKTQCKLYKGSNITVSFRFKPSSKVTSLKHNVFANVAGLPLPFVGVTGTDACAGVTRDGVPSPCPLQPNTEYELVTVIPVESFYPSVKLTVEWALVDQNGRNAVCFTVPATILEAKAKKTKA